MLTRQRFEPDWVKEKPIIEHGNAPEKCDLRGARDCFLFKDKEIFYLYYDAASEKSWGCCLARSTNLEKWELLGRVSFFGKGIHEEGAGYGPVHKFSNNYYMYYLSFIHIGEMGVPGFPYLTGLAVAKHPAGPWEKIATEPLIPLGNKGEPDSVCACAPHVHFINGKYRAFYSAQTTEPEILRGVGLATAEHPEGPWKKTPQPIIPGTEQVENPMLYYEQKLDLWFLWANRVISHPKFGSKRRENSWHAADYTDAIVVYWSKKFDRWDINNKSIALDNKSVKWVKGPIGLPGICIHNNKLYVVFDGCKNPISRDLENIHYNRDIGIAFYNLPLTLRFLAMGTN